MPERPFPTPLGKLDVFSAVRGNFQQQLVLVLKGHSATVASFGRGPGGTAVPAPMASVARTEDRILPAQSEVPRERA